jgi:integrase
LSLAKARDARDGARKALAQGIDPSAVRQQEKREKAEAGANDFETIAREWLENVRDKWAPVYHSDTLKRFEAYVFPAVGRRPITQVAAQELLARLRKIETRGTVETARKVARACGQVFRYGIASGRCERNPAADLRGALKARPKPKHMAALPASELPSFLAKIDGYDGEVQTQLALRLMALTFVRTTELRAATWAEIDLNKAEWTIPAERMKTKTPHHVPLSRQAVEAFRRLQEMNSKWTWIFPGRAPTKPMSKNTVLFALYRMGYHSRMTGHGFRAVASTALNEMGYRPDVIERQLAHSEKNAVRAAYNRSQYLEGTPDNDAAVGRLPGCAAGRSFQGCRLQDCARRRGLTAKVVADYLRRPVLIVQKHPIRTDHELSEGQRVCFSRHNQKLVVNHSRTRLGSSLWNWTPG